MNDHRDPRFATLSAPSPDGPIVDGWSRRAFLQAVGAGAAVASIGLPGWIPGLAADRALAAPPLNDNDGVLVLISLHGGNDGMNTLVPYMNGRYYDNRGVLALQPEAVLRLDHTHGLHPSLATLKSLWDRGMVAAVNGVGFTPPDLSHFTAIATWMVGQYGRTGGPAGWLGRWADGLPPELADLALVSLGETVSLQIQGARRSPGPASIPVQPVLFAPQDPIRASVAGMASATPTERGPWGDAIAAAMSSTMDVADTIMPVHRPGELLQSNVVGKLTMAANLINANVGLRVIEIGMGGWDHHASQAPIHAAMLKTLDDALAAFYGRLAAAKRRQVTIMIVSEFGRTLHSNYSGGTDHGTANTVFLIGDGVAGGYHGEDPRLDNVDRDGRLRSPIDFRQVFGNVLEHWLDVHGAGTDPFSVIGGAYPQLGLFRTTPGAPSSPIPPVPPVVTSAGFVPLSPVRVFDSRDGTGGRETPLVVDEEWRFRLGGRAGVPGEAQAVLLNVTATEVSERTFVTTWDSGKPRPVASNLNPAPGLSTPALVVGRLGERGEVSFTVGHGELDLLADLVGYFDPISDEGFRALPPRRLLDTRVGQQAFQPEQARSLRVTGIPDVPPDATAVALNVTMTLASEATYLTVWPNGEEMPWASSANVIPGQTVANMVVARVGSNGSIGLYNQFGTVDVIVDQLGYFRPGQVGGRYLAMTPQRVLDTRIGLGAPTARVAGGPLQVRVRGVAGVPATAAAVMVNVTADLPTQATHLTVFPTGTPMPLASNLNIVPGLSVPNMVAVPVGASDSVTMVNAFGELDLIADIVGYFTS